MSDLERRPLFPTHNPSHSAPVRRAPLLQGLHRQHVRQRPQVPYQAAPAPLLNLPNQARHPLEEHEAQGAFLSDLPWVRHPVRDEVGGARDRVEQAFEEGAAPAVQLLCVWFGLGV